MRSVDSDALNELASRGLGAVVLSGLAWAYLRGWRRAATASVRQSRRYARRGPRFLRAFATGGGSLRFQTGLHFLGACLTLVVALAFWAAFLGAVLQAARGEHLGTFSPEPVAPEPQQQFPLIARVFLLLLGLALLACGLRQVLWCRAVAQYRQWLYDTSIPLDGEYEDVASAMPAPPLWRIVAAIAWGAALVACGLVAITAALGALG